MKSLDTMTSDERNLLLYLETRAVDYGGIVDTKHMNKEDMDIAKKWNDEEFVKFGRIKFHSLTSTGSYWVELSEVAWKLAHEERKARCIRIMERQKINKTSDRDYRRLIKEVK